MKTRLLTTESNGSTVGGLEQPKQFLYSNNAARRHDLPRWHPRQPFHLHRLGARRHVLSGANAATGATVLATGLVPRRHGHAADAHLELPDASARSQ